MPEARKDGVVMSEAEMIQTTISCPDCQNGDVFDLDENMLVPCSACHGTGEVEVELCTECGRDENGCRCFQQAEEREAA